VRCLLWGVLSSASATLSCSLHSAIRCCCPRTLLYEQTGHVPMPNVAKLCCAAMGLRKVMGGYDMDRVGSLADWAASSGERSFPGFAAEVKG
jgi:hypothetical protein